MFSLRSPLPCLCLHSTTTLSTAKCCNFKKARQNSRDGHWAVHVATLNKTLSITTVIRARRTNRRDSNRYIRPGAVEVVGCSLTKVVSTGNEETGRQAGRYTSMQAGREEEIERSRGSNRVLTGSKLCEYQGRFRLRLRLPSSSAVSKPPWKPKARRLRLMAEVLKLCQLGSG